MTQVSTRIEKIELIFLCHITCLYGETDGDGQTEVGWGGETF